MFQTIPILGAAWLAKKVYDAIMDDSNSDSSGSSTSYDDSERQQRIKTAKNHRKNTRSNLIKKAIADHRQKTAAELKRKLNRSKPSGFKVKVYDDKLTITNDSLKKAENVILIVNSCFAGAKKRQLKGGTIHIALPSTKELVAKTLKNADENYGAECGISHNEQYVQDDDTFLDQLNQLHN
ncbi:hypothetical protein ACFL6Z_03825 [Pseudomonadota bacterium]